MTRPIKLSRQSGPTLLCDGPRATLYAIRGDQGLLRAYDLDGRQRWETTLPSFKVGIFGAQPGGGAYVAWAIDYIATVMPLGSTRVLVQVARQDLESTRGRSRAPGALITPDVVETRAYLLDAATGRILSQAPGAGAPHATRRHAPRRAGDRSLADAPAATGARASSLTREDQVTRIGSETSSDGLAKR
jgi:hypothetical protein